MIRNRIFSSLAIAGLIGFTAACGDTDDETVIEQPVVEEPAPVISEPAPAPITTDTMIHDTMRMDTTPATTPR